MSSDACLNLHLATVQSKHWSKFAVSMKNFGILAKSIGMNGIDPIKGSEGRQGGPRGLRRSFILTAMYVKTNVTLNKETVVRLTSGINVAYIIPDQLTVTIL